MTYKIIKQEFKFIEYFFLTKKVLFLNILIVEAFPDPFFILNMNQTLSKKNAGELPIYTSLSPTTLLSSLRVGLHLVSYLPQGKNNCLKWGGREERRKSKK